MRTPSSPHLLLLAFFLLLALLALSPKTPVAFEPSNSGVADVRVEQNF